jgi:flagellum-specific ATP synthase
VSATEDAVDLDRAPALGIDLAPALGLDLTPALELELAPAREALARADLLRPAGYVTAVVGLVIEATGPAAPVGALCDVATSDGSAIAAEVVGCRDGKALLMPLGALAGVGPGSRVALRRSAPLVAVGPEMLGRVVDGLGRPLDGRGPVAGRARVPLAGRALNPLERVPITEPLDLGVRVLNALVTCGRGQRVGIFAGAGVGKSALLGMAARHARADVTVIALVGERGREVRRFVEHDLGPHGLARSVVVAVTADEPALVRVRGALLATAVAEHFRAAGRDVLLLMDSLTRVATAQREIGLAIGEPPSARGHTPSVFSLLPRLLERAGRDRRGSITGLYTVLLEGDDLADPVADAARTALDGHVVLSRRLAAGGQFPAVDVVESMSRVMVDVTTPAHRAAAARVREWLATHREADDLLQLGAYTRGASPPLDEAVDRGPAIARFLRQPLDEAAALDASIAALAALVDA